MSELLMFLGQAVIVAGVVAALVAGLAVFFRWLPRLGPARPLARVHGAGELFEDGRTYDVLLSSGRRLTGLRFEGMVKAEEEAAWPLRGMAVMARADGGRVILRLDAVRVFEETPDAAAAAGRVGG